MACVLLNIACCRRGRIPRLAAVADSAMKRPKFNAMFLDFAAARRVEFGHAP
jgi:hypothetical protein